MPLENYLLLAPGLIAGRLVAEPWLGLAGSACALLHRRLRYGVFMAASFGALWGALSFWLAGAPASDFWEWLYLAALPTTAVSLLTYGFKQIIPPPRAAPPAE